MKDGDGGWLCTGSHIALCSQEFVERAEGLDPVPQLLEVQLLVRSVQPIVGETDAGQDHRRTGRAEGRHDGNGAAGARGYGAPPRDLLERLIEQLERGVIELDLCRIGAVQKPYARGDVLRREPQPGGQRCRSWIGEFRFGTIS